MDFNNTSSLSLSSTSSATNSLLVILLDFNPYIWGKRRNATQDSSGKTLISFSQMMNHFLVFVRAHLFAHEGNRVAIIGASSSRCYYLYPTPPQRENQNDSNNNENENNRFIDIQDLWIVVSAFIGLIIVYASILLIYGLVALFYIRSLRVPKNRNRFLRNYFNNNIRLTLISIPGLTYFSIYHLSLGSGTFQIVLSSIITFLCFMFWISISILLIWNRKRLHNDKMFREKFGCLYEDYKNNRWMFAIIHLAYRSAIAFFAAISYVHNITGITLALASAILFFSSILLGQPFHSRSLNAFRGITSAIEVVVLALNLMVINDSVNPSAVAIQIHGAAVIVLCCIKMMLTISFYIGQFVIKLRQGEISLPFWKKHSVESEAGKAPKQASKKYGEPEGSKCSSDEEMEEIENNNENE
eukprot:gb/GECH01010881.1/.p1 GENE.gb/GECH01010881.1/~~gb/GECH01010881.1/.p1  ORF type:complete len:414 (+),score=84.83 gb/GECH01010881.1/:1-1242(+)